MNRHIQVILTLLLLISLCRGQDSIEPTAPSPAHAIGITIGMNQLKEEDLLPRVHAGFVTSVSYDYRRVGDNYQGLAFSLAYSRVIATPEDITKSANVLIASSYSYCFEIGEAKRFTFFIGPQAKIAYSASFYPNWDESHLYWSNSFSLGINNVAFTTFEDGTKLFSTISIGVLSLYSRPDALRLYKYDDVTFGGIVKNLHDNLRVGLIGKTFGVHFDVEYQFPLFQTKMEAVFYSFDFTRIGKGDALPFTQLIHQLGLKILL